MKTTSVFSRAFFVASVGGISTAPPPGSSMRPPPTQKAVIRPPQGALCPQAVGDLFVPQVRSGASQGTKAPPQPTLEQKLKSNLQQALKSGNPQDIKRDFSWKEVFDQIPAGERGATAKRLLAEHLNKRETSLKILSELPPVDGVREVVQEALANSPFLKQTNLKQTKPWTPEELERAFGEGRWEKFFPDLFKNPGLPRPLTSHSVRVAALSVGSQQYSPSELNRWKGSDGVLLGVLGFRPVFSLEELIGQSTRRFRGPKGEFPESLESQLRGLVVQGMHRRTGLSLFEEADPQTNRLLKSQMNVSLEASLMPGGALTETSPLVRSWFVAGWSEGLHEDVVHRVREHAAQLTWNLKGFEKFRIRIHNLPTPELLKELQDAHLERGVNPDQKLHIQHLLSATERFVQFNKNNVALETEINQMPLRASEKTHLLSLMPSLKKPASEANLERLQALYAIRQEAAAAQREPGASLPNVRMIWADRALSAQAMRAGDALIDPLPLKSHSKELDLDKISSVGDALLNHVILDGALSPQVAQNIVKEIHLVLNDASLPPLKKAEMMELLYSNAVDQVIYGVSNSFAPFDAPFRHAFVDAEHQPRFIDTVLRSSNIFVLSKLTDQLSEEIARRKGTVHRIQGVERREPVEVFTEGRAVGTLRVDPRDPLALKPTDIAVLPEILADIAPVSGIIALEGGARLSHLQLLAKSLGIPHIKISESYWSDLKALDGKQVELIAEFDGSISLKEIPPQQGLFLPVPLGKKRISPPLADTRIQKTVDFDQAAELDSKGYANMAGPKGMQLVRMRRDPTLEPLVPQGFLLPFGFFERYAKESGLKSMIFDLVNTPLTQPFTVSARLAAIRKRIHETPVPEAMLDEVMSSLEKLQKKTGHEGGFFFRSDTNLEDLPGFNGAGLNETVPNVRPSRSDVDAAIRKVWASPFKEKSVAWRARAVDSPNVTMAYPSVVVMPTVEARSSGVLTTRSGPRWDQPGHGYISANWGIGSVVQAEIPVEEISLSGAEARRTGFTVADVKPTAGVGGGLVDQPILPGLEVLSKEQITQLNETGIQIEKVLGSSPHGWDIEWAFDRQGRLKIVQARPNM